MRWRSTTSRRRPSPRTSRSSVPEHALPAELLSLIYRRTEGHALFLVDLMRDLRRRGVIDKTAAGQCVLSEGLPALERELPESVAA